MGLPAGPRPRQERWGPGNHSDVGTARGSGSRHRRLRFDGRLLSIQQVGVDATQRLELGDPDS